MCDNFDYGPEPFTINIQKSTCKNNNFRTALWTGNHLQLTLMSIPVGGEIGLKCTKILINFCALSRAELWLKWVPAKIN